MVSVYWPDLNLDKGKSPTPGKSISFVFSKSTTAGEQTLLTKQHCRCILVRVVWLLARRNIEVKESVIAPDLNCRGAMMQICRTLKWHRRPSSDVKTRLPHVHTEENPVEAATQKKITCFFCERRKHKPSKVCLDKSISLNRQT